MVNIPNDTIEIPKKYTFDIIMPWIGEEVPKGWEEYEIPLRKNIVRR